MTTLIGDEVRSFKLRRRGVQQEKATSLWPIGMAHSPSRDHKTEDTEVALTQKSPASRSNTAKGRALLQDQTI